MSARKAQYAKSDDAGLSREARMSKLKVELRDHIRLLSDYELLSNDWMTMAASLHQIANVAFMETRLTPVDDNPLLQAGKKDSGTLWDQERDEIAIRILLEEGKLNLALRILHKYKQASREEKYEETVAEAAKRFNCDAITVVERGRAFEQSVGALLKFAFVHVEALQILDLPEFTSHIRDELDAALALTEKPPGADIDKMQIVLFVHYLGSLGSHFDDMPDEDRIMDLIQEQNIIPLFIEHMRKHYTWYKLDALQASARFLDNAFGSEAYTTDRSRFIPDEEVQKNLVALKGLYVSELVATHGTRRRDVQRLLDEFERFERVVGPTTAVPLKLGDKDDSKEAPKK